MPLPNFLIIGAMKSGTTTLYRDLLTHPRVYLPIDKEVHALIHSEALSTQGKAEYSKHFDSASPEQCLGEASTGYTKRPTHEGVAQRAKKVLGPDTKIIYIVREPISRALSHHYHAFSWNEIHGDANRAIHEDSTFIDYSRYAYQIEPWLEQFGRDNITVIKFEDYVKNRQAHLASLCEFLEIDPADANAQQDTVFNKGDNRPIHKGVLTTLNRSAIYRKALRNIIPPSFRQFLYRTVFPKAPDRPAPPSSETLRYMKQHIEPDMARLPALLGQGAPKWDLDAAIEKILNTTASTSETSPAHTTESARGVRA